MTDPKRAAGGASRAPRGGAPHQRGKRTGGQIALGLFKWIGILALTVAVLGVGAFVFIYANTTIPKPNDEFQTNVSTVYFSDGEQPMSTFFVHNRQSIPLSEMPENVKQAIVAAENETFWEDRGISVPGLLRAVQTALTPGVDTVGGSTITQQYVKVRYLTQDKTITRKLTEIIVALKVNQDLTKEEILEGYLNTVYFGRGAYGIQTAAQAYFSKDAKDLDDQQAVALSAIINAPNHLDPARGECVHRADALGGTDRRCPLFRVHDEPHASRQAGDVTDRLDRPLFFKIRDDTDRFHASAVPSLRHHARNSTLPSGPRNGDGTQPSQTSPSDSVPNALIAATTASCTAGSRTTPPGTFSRPASNCGLISESSSPPGGRTSAIGGRISLSEMNETSVTPACGCSGRSESRR